MAENLSKNTIDALYGTTRETPTAIPIKKETKHRHRHHHRRSAKPFSQEKPYKPYMLVGAVSVALVLILFIMSI